MALLATFADRLAFADRNLLSGRTASMMVAVAVAAGAAALISCFDPLALLSNPAFLKTAESAPFEARFFPSSISSSVSLPARPTGSVSSQFELRFAPANALLDQSQQAHEQAAATVEQSATLPVASVPVPRPRPVELAPNAVATEVDNRTLLQKLSDLFPARIKLASLAPDGGLLGSGPNLSSLGYDRLTAVYDISARAVYLPGGAKLEAHSGFGGLMDDPNHVSERNVGATPPAIYELKPRQRLFHGIEAIRMIPTDENATLGRSGLLAHSYMLGPNGDSNGCVSIKDYETFLRAFKNGEINRLVVVPSLEKAVVASRTSQS